MTLKDCIGRLEKFYGLLPSPPAEPFQLFVWEVLSTDSPPAKRDAAYAALKRARALTPDAMRRAPPATLEGALKLIGPYFEPRLDALKNGADAFRRNPEIVAAMKGSVRAARRALKPLLPPGDAGAHRMLLFGGEHLVLPIDARLQRVALRLGFGMPDPRPRKSARSIRRALTKELPPDVETYRRAFLYLSHHGASTCTAADPHCSVCPLLPDCAEGKRRLQI